MRVLDYARNCGSHDIYLIADSVGWYVVHGVEIDQTEAMCRAAMNGEGSTQYGNEDAAISAFEKLKETT